MQIHQNGLIIYYKMIDGIIVRDNLKGLRSKLSEVLLDADLANPINLEDMFKNIISFLLIGSIISMFTFIAEIVFKSK